jgi:hypothetical protein
MAVKRRRLPNFEACSVALFATFVFAGPLAPRTPMPNVTVRQVASPPQSPTPSHLRTAELPKHSR